LRLALLATHFADYSLELAFELAAAHQVLLIADREKLAAECDPARVARASKHMRLALMSQNRRDRRILTDVWARARLSAFRPDAVIAHEHLQPHVTRIQRHAAAISSLLLIVHDPDPHQGRDAELASRLALQREAQRGQADHLFVHGPYCLDRLRSVVARDKPIHSIAHGPIMRPSAFTPPPGRRRALMFGRMEAYKGLDTLLEAYRALASQGVAAELHLAGQGPELDRLGEDFAALPACTVERGYVSRDRAIAAMQGADFIIAPYKEATQSGVVAAAFANGRPVLATRVGGLPDFVIDGVNGVLVPADDPAALADAVARWPDGATALAEDLGRGASATIENAMNWRVAARAIEAAAIAK
jgi:glycosyltransferase involved in cell wall biosynthesis